MLVRSTEREFAVSPCRSSKRTATAATRDQDEVAFLPYPLAASCE